MLHAAGRLVDPRTAACRSRTCAPRGGPDGTWRADKRYWKPPRSSSETYLEAVDWTLDGERKMLTLQALEVLAAAG